MSEWDAGRVQAGCNRRSMPGAPCPGPHLFLWDCMLRSLLPLGNHAALDYCPVSSTRTNHLCNSSCKRTCRRAYLSDRPAPELTRPERRSCGAGHGKAAPFGAGAPPVRRPMCAAAGGGPHGAPEDGHYSNRTCWPQASSGCLGALELREAAGGLIRGRHAAGAALTAARLQGRGQLPPQRDPAPGQAGRSAPAPRPSRPATLIRAGTPAAAQQPCGAPCASRRRTTRGARGGARCAAPPSS